MTSTLSQPARSTGRPSVGVRRVGYLVAAVFNAVMLWVAHQLLDWEWPGFLTADFDDLLPWVTVSFVASIVANLVFAVDDSVRIKAAGNVATNLISFVVAVRTWQIYPFDFSGYGTDWSWLVRTVLVVAIVGTAAGTIAELVKLLQRGGPAADDRSASTER